MPYKDWHHNRIQSIKAKLSFLFKMLFEINSFNETVAGIRDAG